MDPDPHVSTPRLYTLPELARAAGRGERSISFLVRQYETVTGQPLPRRQRRNFMERVLSQREFDLLLEVMRAYDKSPGEHSYLDLIRKRLGQALPVVQVDPDPAASTLAALLAPVMSRLEEVVDRLVSSPVPGVAGPSLPSTDAIRAEAMTRMVDGLLEEEPQWMGRLRTMLETQGTQIGELRSEVRALAAEVTALRVHLPENLMEVPRRLGHLSTLIERELSGEVSGKTEEVAS